MVSRGVNTEPAAIMLGVMTAVLHFKGMQDVVIDKVLGLELSAIS
jgi:NO-binding membrane sensor protein with MHYT domain